MYNEAVKQRFIETFKNKGSKLYAISLMRRLAVLWESNLDKEVAEMSKREIIDGLSRIHYISYTSIRTDLYVLKKYFNWYNSNINQINVENAISISAEDIDLSESLRAELVKEEDELIGILSFTTANEGYYEIPVILLSWCGLTLDEILKLRNEDVIFKDGSVFVQSDRKVLYIRSEKIIDLLKDYRSTKSRVVECHGRRELFPDEIGFFIKNMVTVNSKFIGKPLTATAVRKKIDAYNRITPEHIKKITIDGVFLSGGMHRILENEIETGKISTEVVVNELRAKLRLANDAVNLYRAYKKAFDIKVEN